MRRVRVRVDVDPVDASSRRVAVDVGRRDGRDPSLARRHRRRDESRPARGEDDAIERPGESNARARWRVRGPVDPVVDG